MDSTAVYCLNTLIIAVLLGLIPAAIAQKKGRGFVAWWLFGAALFIVALPAALLLKPDMAEIERRQLEEETMKRCPHCAELVKREAKVCKHCGHDLTVSPQPKNRQYLCDRKIEWEAWEEKHAWPLREYAYKVTGRFIEAQKRLGKEASPAAFQHYIARESGQEFPLELCQILLTEIAMMSKDQVIPPIPPRSRSRITEVISEQLPEVDNEGAIERMPKTEPSEVDNEVVTEKIAKAPLPTVSQEQPQVHVRKESPTITDVDKLVTFGQMAIEQGWYDKAREYFEQALALDASNREVLKGLAQVYERLSHRGADRNDYEKDKVYFPR